MKKSFRKKSLQKKVDSQVEKIKNLKKELKIDKQLRILQ